MPNKCDYCPTPIDWKKDTWIERHTAGKPVESHTRGLLLEAPLSGEVTRQDPSVLRARIHPPIEHAGAGTPPRGLRLVTPVPTTGHKGGAPKRQYLAHLWPAVSKGFLAR
jgi:hypothetical protein